MSFPKPKRKTYIYLPWTQIFYAHKNFFSLLLHKKNQPLLNPLSFTFFLFLLPFFFLSSLPSNTFFLNKKSYNFTQPPSLPTTIVPLLLPFCTLALLYSSFLLVLVWLLFFLLKFLLKIIFLFFILVLIMFRSFNLLF